MKFLVENVLPKWKQFTLINIHKMKVSILNYGGIITRIEVPDKNGTLENIVLSYKNFKDYLKNPNYFGALIGRVAGRINNASFTLDGKTYQLEANEAPNHLHGGSQGFHQVTWEASPFQTDHAVGVKLSHTSKNREGGYPGEINVTVTYTLNNDNELTIDYSATSDQTTVLALTNHSYFNLSGNLKDTILNHHVTIKSNQFGELNEALMPTGRLLNVEGTAFDFRKGKKLHEGIASDSKQNRIVGSGYDHYFIFAGNSQEKIIVKEEKSRRIMTINTNQPGMVMYTGNSLEKGWKLAEGESKEYLGVCFETQAHPASLHHPLFPSVVLKANEPYQKQTIFSFGVYK